MVNKRKEKTGVVVSDKMNKTIVVKVETIKRHSAYKKITRGYKKFKAHDEGNKAKVGDKVRIGEVRPISKEKRWVLLGVGNGRVRSDNRDRKG
ncbi:MAG: 30S ribosomal protein S17 [Candidatus Omnitrophota bacterium]